MIAPTNQLAVSQVVDWLTLGLVNSLKCLMQHLEYTIAKIEILGRLHYCTLSVLDVVRIRVRARFSAHVVFLWLLKICCQRVYWSVS